jgi:hypothetical protein
MWNVDWDPVPLVVPVGSVLLLAPLSVFHIAAHNTKLKWLVCGWSKRSWYFYFIYSGSRISDPGHKIENNFEQVQKKKFEPIDKYYSTSFTQKIATKLYNMGPGVKKAQNPRSGSATLEIWLSYFSILLIGGAPTGHTSVLYWSREGSLPYAFTDFSYD